MSENALHAFLARQDTYRDKPERLRFLYSHFSFRRDSNPAGFAGAVAFWRDLLTDVTKAGLQKGEQNVQGADHLVLHADNGLIDRLRWNDSGRPGDIGTVLGELAASKDIFPLEAFLASPSSIYSSSWPSWLLSTLVGKPLWWTTRNLGLSTEEHVTPEEAWKRCKGSWVVMSNLEQAADRISAELDELTNATERLFTTSDFRAAFASEALSSVTLTGLDMKVLVRFLERDKRKIATDGDAIKILTAGEPQRITETDRGILRVSSGVEQLQRQVDELERRIAELSKRAATYVKNGNKDGARAALRTRTLLTSTLAERTGQLENLSAVKIRIDNAVSDAAMLAAYETASQTLKSLTPERERVDKVTDELCAAVDDQREISEALNAIGGLDSVELDNDALEAEFKALEREQQQETEHNALRSKHALEGAQPVEALPKPAAGATSPSADKEPAEGSTPARLSTRAEETPEPLAA